MIQEVFNLFRTHPIFRTNLGPQDPGSETEKIACSKAIFNICGALKAYLKLDFKPYSIISNQRERELLEATKNKENKQISNHLNFLKISIFGQRLPLWAPTI